MELFLHLGAHRTGSTAMQRLFARNAGVLGEAGIEVWGPDILREKPHFYLPETEGFAEGAEEAFAADLAEVRADRLVLSEENMIGSMRLNLLRRTLYDDLPARLVAYGSLIDRNPTRIGFGIREYASYWASAYTYLLPRHGLPRFEELRPGLVALERGWLDVLGELRVLFPKAEIMVWPLESVQTRMRAMTARFLDIAPGRLDDVPRRVNAAPAPGAIEQVHALRAAHPGITPEALEPLLAEAPPPEAEAAPLFSDDDILALGMRYADDLAALEAGVEGITFVTDPRRGAA